MQQLIAESDPDFKQQMELLLQQRSIEQLIDPNLVFGDLKNNRAALWSLLYFSGYLIATATRPEELAIRCQLVIPNREVFFV